MGKNSNLRRKMDSQSGLTLVELLITILLITLAGGVIVATIDLATKQFQELTQDSDAQLLCSALSLYVQNELTYAGDVRTVNGQVTFTDHARNLGTGCYFDTKDGRLVVHYGGSEYEAVGTGTYGGTRSHKKLAETHTVTYEGGVATVTIEVRAAGETRVLASNTFLVRPIAPGTAA